ncbi:MAG: hypothetical protein ACKOPU_03360 [Candidatus Planktophila sp.]
MAMTDTVMQKLIEKEGCQYIGPDQDPRKGPVKICGHKVIDGKAYCAEHYPVVYMVGSSITKLKRSASPVAEKQRWEGEISELMWELYEELLAEGEIEA